MDCTFDLSSLSVEKENLTFVLLCFITAIRKLKLAHMKGLEFGTAPRLIIYIKQIPRLGITGIEK
jgi:hypothetical protein